MATKEITLREKYYKDIVPNLKKELSLGNSLAVPRIEKVVVNAGVGKRTKEEKYIDAAASDISKITGQRPVKTVAKKAIAGFKIREGNVVGLKVTLRGKRMFDFLEKLTRVALPRVRDFRGISPTGFDKSGNYNLGIREHLVFPEIQPDAAEYTFPLEVTVVTTAKNQEEGFKLLKQLGFPFKEEVKE
jgi:large subunit ribosomal protein L5